MKHAILSAILLSYSMAHIPSAMSQAVLDKVWPLTMSGLEVTGDSSDRTYLTAVPHFSITGSQEKNNLPGILANDTRNVNIGLEINPLDGLHLRADAWRLQVEDTQVVNSLSTSDFSSTVPQPSLNDSIRDGFFLVQPFPGSQLQSNGVDLGASYVWATNKTGQFTLSTKATYVYNFSQLPNLLELAPSAIGGTADSPSNPELQGNITLTWQIGNHIASAGTNYFDSLKDVGELDIDAINKLVDDMVTLDLQYGYELWAGKQDQAIISFGVRNVFDEKTTQILNQGSRSVDQNGRVTYGSIKYRF